MNKFYKWLFVVALFTMADSSPLFAKSRQENVNYISRIKDKGIKIKKPGVYRLTKDIKFDLDDGKAAISIEASNVILDLNQFTLNQKGEGQNNYGILIKANHQSVTIQNGTISNIHGFGIKVEEDNHIIHLQDLIIKSCGSNGSDILISDNFLHTGGILFLGSSSLPITDIILSRCLAVNNTTSNPQVAVNGLLMSDVEKITIENSHFSDNTGPSEVGVAGAEFFHTKNCSIKNSYADENSNNPASGASASCFGFHFNAFANSVIDSTEHFNIKITNSTANRTSGNVIRAAGFRFRQAKNIVVEDSESHQTTNTLLDPVGVDQTVTAAAGFIASICDDFTFRNCSAYEHLTALGSLRIVGGFDIARSNYGLIIDCHAARCQNQGEGILGGFITEPALSRPDFDRNLGIIFENCISEGNLGGPSGGGFAFFRAEDSKIIKCEAIANTPNGIDVGRVPIIPADDTIQSIIKDNLVIGNSVIGIIDENASLPPNANNNAYLGNIARDNTVNFLLPPGTPITIWALSLGNTPVAECIDNIDIQ